MAQQNDVHVSDSSDEEETRVLAAEYEHSPVPQHARLGLWQNIWVWIGFPAIITGAMTGSILVLGMGFQRALVAMVIGNILMGVYTGFLGQLGARTGKSYALIATGIFGKKGYIFSSGLLATLLLGWYLVQVGITGALVASAYDLNYILMTVIAGVLYFGITFIGVKGLYWIGTISAPAFFILGLWVLFDSAANAGWSSVWAYAGNHGVATMSMGVGLTVVLALFVDAATVAADFDRWTKSTRDSWIATLTAFPLANLVAMLVGGVMTAALAVPDANPFGQDNMFGYMNSMQLTWLSVIAFIFLYINLGSVCSHVFYNAVTGWSRIVNGSFRVVAIPLGIIGIIIAATKIWTYFIGWLTILGILVPPIGGVVLVDQFLFEADIETDSDWHWRPFLAWAIGSIVGLIVQFEASYASTAICAFLAGAISYLIICLVTGTGRTRAGEK